MRQILGVVAMAAMLTACTAGEATANDPASQLVAAGLGGEGYTLSGSALTVADDNTFSGTVNMTGNGEELVYNCTGKIEAGEVTEHECSLGGDMVVTEDIMAPKTAAETAVEMAGEGAVLVSSQLKMNSNGEMAGPVVVRLADGTEQTYDCTEIAEGNEAASGSGCSGR